MRRVRGKKYEETGMEEEDKGEERAAMVRGEKGAEGAEGVEGKEVCDVTLLVSRATCALSSLMRA